ncbi:hypothetical protein ACYATP_07500 [Lactobacillaceae bacterium Melli_B4]
MTLKYNTILIKFVRIYKISNDKYYFNYKLPLSSKSYAFFVSPFDRRHLDIGSTVLINNNHRDVGLGIVIDNFTEYNSKNKHLTINGRTNRHIRNYIRAQYNNNRFAETVYRRFQIDARKARKKMAIEQLEKNTHSNKK